MLILIQILVLLQKTVLLILMLIIQLINAKLIVKVQLFSMLIVFQVNVSLSVIPVTMALMCQQTRGFVHLDVLFQNMLIISQLNVPNNVQVQLLGLIILILIQMNNLEYANKNALLVNMPEKLINFA